MVCFALFIEPATVSVAGGLWTLHGDGRSFSSNSDRGASRGYIMIDVANQKVIEKRINPTIYVNEYVCVEAGCVATSDRPFTPSDDNKLSVTFANDGSFTITFGMVLAGDLEDIAPHINGKIVFQPDGKGGYTAAGNRDGFPWAEAYYHDGQGSRQFQK